jgi:multiple antibiotic resistance protein
MISAIIGFLVMLNPFALFLYLKPVMQSLSSQDFNRVFIKASIISFCIFLVFLLFGDYVFTSIFRIRFDSFRIFGGTVLFSFAWLFIVNGKKAFVQIRGDLHEMAAEIALPFMVGAGTISLATLMSKQLPTLYGFLALLIVMITNYGFIMGMKKLRSTIRHQRLKEAFDKIMELLLRVNGFFLGAIGIDMMMTGINQLFDL